MRYPLVVLLIFAGCSAAFSQISNCPNILVLGPAGFPSLEEPIRYTVQIEPPEKAVGLSYLWKVITRNGERGMVRGQGTTQIEVPFTEDHLTVTVDVKGLPDGCPGTASETMHVDWAPQPVKLAQITGNLSSGLKLKLPDIHRQIANHPSARLVAIIYPGKGGSVQAKKKLLISHFSDKSPKLGNGLTMVASNIKLDKVVFWLVPAGADLPKP